MNYSWGSAAPDKNPLCAETYPHICYIGAVLGGAVNGATSLNFWRYNHAVNLDPIQRRREGVKLAFSMLDTLAAWGGRTARIPQDIAILRSRASEDWFQLKVLYGDYPGDRIDNTRGFDHFHWLALQLLQNGYLFETYFQDHAEAWEHAESFKVIILPFPYSMSMTAFGTLAAAVAKGVRVIAIGARGETDELGNPYPQPLLKGLNDDGKVGYFDPDLQEKGSYPETVKTFFNILDTSLGDGRTLTLTRYGKDIQAGCLVNSDADKLIVLINWSDFDAVADLGVRMTADKRYRILQRDLDGVRLLKLCDNESVTSSDLNSFRVPLKAGEAKILRIAE